MNEKLLLAKSITLLWVQSKMDVKQQGIEDIVRSIVDKVRMPEETMGLDQNKDIIDGLCHTIERLILSLSGQPFDKVELIQQITMDCMDDITTLEAIKGSIEQEYTQEELSETSLSIQRFFKAHQRDQDAIEAVKNFSADVLFKRKKTTNLRALLAEHLAKLEPFTTGGAEDVDPGVVASFGLDDDDKLTEVYEQIKERESGLGAFTFGFQRINKMFGGSIGAGKTMVIGALQHQHKTGFSLALFRQALMYNKPHLKDPTKKPAMLRISTEDEIGDNMEQLFRNTYFNITKTVPDMSQFDSTSMKEYLQENLRANGWHPFFMRINPSLWTYQNICQEVLRLESLGYEVKLVMVDYLPMIPTTGCEEGPSGHALRDMYRRVRNFFSARGITFITPHQLSVDAVKLLRQGVTDFVRQLPDRNFYAGSSQISHEVDAELFIHIERPNGVSWLTCQRGKYRNPTIIEDKHLYCALPFHPQGGLQDDLNGPDLGRSAPGGGDPSQGEDEKPFWLL